MNCYWGCFFWIHACVTRVPCCFCIVSLKSVQVAARWSSIVTVARTNRVVDGDITLRHGIGLDPCWQAGAIWGYSGAKIKEALGTKIYKDVLKFREEAATAKNTVNTWKGHWHFLCRPHLWGVAAKKYWVLSTRAGARYSPVFGLRGLDLWICVSICVSNCCCFFLKHVEVTEVIASVQLF